MNARPSTLILAAALAGCLVYAGYLQRENARLRALAGTEPAAFSLPSETGETGTEWLGSADEASAESAGESQPVVPYQAQLEREERRSEDWRERRRERMARMAAAFEDPEMRLDMVERQIQRVDQQFAGFFRGLRLGPGQMDTLRTLMAERGVVDWEMRMRRFAAGSEEERERLAAAGRLQHEMIDEEIETLLGEEQADRLRHYAESLPYRGEVEALATSLSFTRSPLSEEQAEELVRAMQSVSSEYEYSVDLSDFRGRSRGQLTEAEVGRYFEERAARDAMVLERAAGALEDEQLAALAERQIADRERDRRRFEFMLQGRAMQDRP